MANRFLKAEKIARQGLGLLQAQLIEPRLIVRKGIEDFKGARGDTLTIKVPSILRGREYEWRSRNAEIETDDLEQFSVPITLNKHPYSAVGVTDEELTLDIDDWGADVAVPQVRAVGEQITGYVVQAMARARTRHTAVWEEGDGSADDRSFTQMTARANRLLNDENVPKEDRILLVGGSVEEAALNAPGLLDVDKSGSDGALRAAIIGRVRGFTVVASNNVAHDFAIAFHPTAFALGNVAPEIPEGATAGAKLEFDGLAMRWIKDYEATKLRDRSVYSAFAGATSVNDGRDLVSEVGEGFGELTDENVRAVLIDFIPRGSGS